MNIPAIADFKPPKVKQPAHGILEYLTVSSNALVGASSSTPHPTCSEVHTPGQYGRRLLGGDAFPIARSGQDVPSFLPAPTSRPGHLKIVQLRIFIPFSLYPETERTSYYQ